MGCWCWCCCCKTEDYTPPPCFFLFMMSVIRFFILFFPLSDYIYVSAFYSFVACFLLLLCYDMHINIKMIIIHDHTHLSLSLSLCCCYNHICSLPCVSDREEKENQILFQCYYLPLAFLSLFMYLSTYLSMCLLMCVCSN